MQPLARAVLGGAAARADAEEFVFTRSAARRSELRRLRQHVRAASMRAVDTLRQASRARPCCAPPLAVPAGWACDGLARGPRRS